MRTSNLGLKEKVHNNYSNYGLKFQTGVLDGQMHINSLNLRLNFKPRFDNLEPSVENFKPRFDVYINSGGSGYSSFWHYHLLLRTYQSNISL